MIDIFSRRRRVTWRTIAAVGTAAVGLVGLAVPAYAVQAEPPADWSYYVNTQNGATLEQLGVNQGNFDRNNHVSSEVILDFGGEVAYGNGETKTVFSGIYLSASTVQYLAEEFALGYHDASNGSESLTLVVGTNNDIAVTSYDGANWANDVVVPVSSWASSLPDVIVRGGSDMELGWAGPSWTRAWSTGWSGATSLLYVDYGDAAGCPTYTSTNGNCTPSHGEQWKQDDVWYIGWGNPAALAFPEIYFNVSDCANGWQWARISQDGIRYHGAQIYFEGPLDDHARDPNSMTPQLAWTCFWNAVNGAGTPSTAENFTFAGEPHDTGNS